MVNTYSTLPTAVRCTRCKIGIASDEVEAWSIRIPFAPLVNTRVGNLCIGCAGEDDRQRIDELAALLSRENLMKGKPVSDEEIRGVWERLIDGREEAGCVDTAAGELGIGHAALTMRLRKLALPYPGRRKTDDRLPLSGNSGNGVHAETARPMVAASAVEAAPVGAQTLLGGDTVSPPKPEETAVLPVVGYGILHDMIGLLPVHGRWTAEERGLWLDAFTALVKLYTREVRP